MAAKKKAVVKPVKTVKNEDYSALEMYAISMHEYFLALKAAGFPESMALTLLMDTDSHPEWMLTKPPTKAEINQHLEDDEDD